MYVKSREIGRIEMMTLAPKHLYHKGMMDGFVSADA